MEPTVKRDSENQQVQIVDEQGRVIGVISRPVESEILGPGREKVYLARHSGEHTSHAA